MIRNHRKLNSFKRHVTIVPTLFNGYLDWKCIEHYLTATKIHLSMLSGNKHFEYVVVVFFDSFSTYRKYAQKGLYLGIWEQFLVETQDFSDDTDRRSTE